MIITDNTIRTNLRKRILNSSQLLLKQGNVQVQKELHDKTFQTNYKKSIKENFISNLKLF